MGCFEIRGSMGFEGLILVENFVFQWFDFWNL